VAKVGALLLLVAGEGRFVPASIAVAVASAPPITRVPGGPPGLIGVALHEGVVVPVLSIGPARREMVVCSCNGELVALLGGEGFETGVFETHDAWPDVVQHRGVAFAALDVSGLYAEVERAALREPWTG
jgi:hypothetical protein